MVYVIRKEHFNAAHRLFNPAWSDEKNQEIFGPCANNNWHGHNFELIVTVKGMPDPDTGFVYDLKQLGDLIKKEIIDHVDHKNLNLDVPFMKDKLASCEILVMEFWKILAPKIASTSQYYIIAGEASGDLHGSNLIKELISFDSSAEIQAWGGDEMKQAGAKVLVHHKKLAIMGLLGVLQNLSRLQNLFKLFGEQI